MSSFSDSIKSSSTALVSYDPTLPHVSIASHLQSLTDKGVSRLLKTAQFETEHLPVENPFVYIAKHLPEMVSFPFSGVIAIQIGDGPIIQASHCPEQAEFTSDQPFNVLSVGKIFTTIAIMQLIEEGKFSLKTPLSELLDKEELDVLLKDPYLAAKPERTALENLSRHADKITIEHLLTHTAGFVERRPSMKEGIAEGESWDKNNVGYHFYSNYGFQLLAKIVGKHSDEGDKSNHEMGFRTHIEKRIFKPAGMQGAICELHSPTRAKLDSFEISKTGKRTSVDGTEPYPHGNGCWRMTASDLLAFSRAMHEHHVLMSEDSFKIIQEHHSGTLGLWVDRNPESRSIIGYGHPGSGPGMSSFLHHWRTDPPITVAVLSNYSGCEMVQPMLRTIIEKDFVSH